MGAIEARQGHGTRFFEKLPFKDGAFDFVIASHVLEYSAQPEQFIADLQQVAKAGYIEVPDAFMERINPYTVHRLEITCRDGKLIIRKKPAHIVEHDTVALYEHRAKPFITRELIPKRPFVFHLRIYWKIKTDYSVVNPNTDASWAAESGTVPQNAPVANMKTRVQGLVLDMARSVLSQNRRNRMINLINLLIFPSCGSGILSRTPDGLHCNDCDSAYPIRQGIPVTYPETTERK